MSKQDILEGLSEKKGAEQDNTRKVQIDHICDIIRIMPESEIEKTAPEINRYIKDDISRTDYNILDVILNNLKDWIRRHPNVTEGYVLDSMNKRSRRILKIFLAIIGTLAILAIPFAILNCVMGENFCWGYGDDVAGILGTLDFALGAWGFIWERLDDMKKKEVRTASKGVEETGEVDKFIKICKDNSVRQFNIFGKNIIDNGEHIHY